MSGISDRMQEIKRRRKRQSKLAMFQRKLKKATASEKTLIAEKIRRMTPGCEQVLKNLNLADR